MTATRLLLLGGTSEALALAEHLSGRPELDVISSLAGRTVAHRLPAGQLRVGGFGGVLGLAAYLRQHAIDLVVDATHPFAAKISRHAAAACAAVGVRRLQLLRPAWNAAPGDRWHPVTDLAAAATALPDLGHTAFLAIGRQELAAFAGLAGVRLVARMIELPAESLPGDWRLVLARGPFTEAGEAALFAEHGITVVVSKNSGGDQTYAKIAAARAAGLPVVMVDRPPAPDGERAETVAAALAWITAATPPRLAAPASDG
jgi:precorrin-6A/cobalt-precorrin-6A reductase